MRLTFLEGGLFLHRITRFKKKIRIRKTMLDSDLTELFGVETKNLNKAVNRNIKRFPEDFMFQLNKEEYNAFKVPNWNLKERSTFTKSIY